MKKLNAHEVKSVHGGQDVRLMVVAAPLLIAASWALYNIGRLAIQQVERLER